MKKEAVIGKVVIVLTEHPVFGLLLMPYLVEKLEDETLQLVELAFHASETTLSEMTGAERKAMEIASHYTEKYLMEVYSREKNVSKFLRKMSEDSMQVKTKIRPFIEKKLLEMLELLKEEKLPLYQKLGGSKILYAHHAYRVHPRKVETRFLFKINKESFTYSLQCYYEKQPLSLTELKPTLVLTSNPVTLIMGMNVYSFSHIESARILPFTKKNSISVGGDQVEKYIDNILLPIARYHTVLVQGMRLHNEDTTCEALLYLEESLYGYDALRISFRYGDYCFTPGSLRETKKMVYRKKSGALAYFRRNAVAEEKALRLLEVAGLQRIGDAYYKLAPDAPEATLTEWIARHRELLQEEFHLISEQEQLPYCLDEIRIEKSYENGPDWFELHIVVVVGDLRIPFTQFRKHILEEKREYRLPDGRVLLLPEEWFSKYANMFEKGKSTSTGIMLNHALLGIVQSVFEGKENKILPANLFEPLLPAPLGLKATLRTYQQRGFSWMVHLREQSLGGCLADDMGLGKTLQTLALLQYVYQPAEPVKKEETTFSQEVSSQEMFPSYADEKGQFSLFSFSSEEELLPQYLPAKGAVSLQVVPSEPVAGRKPASLIVVPTSLLHNWRREAKRFTTLSMAEYSSTSSIRKDHPERFFGRYNIILTSYGMMRNNLDLLSQYCFEYIVLDESQNIKNSDSLTFRVAIQLRSHHRLVLTGTPIENSLKDLWSQFHFLQPELLGKEGDFHKRFIVPIRQGNKRMETRLQQLISPFILRRTKKEVAPELPSLTEEIIYCDMSEAQADCYTREKNRLRNTLLQQGLQKENSQPLVILNGILRLRQLACHPTLVLPDFAESSGKTEQILDTFDTLRSEGHKVLIFSSFVKHLELMAEMFRQRGWKYALLTGSTANRPEEIAHFTEQDDVQAFLISLKAGGVGLNLTQADYVFIIDPWWNPAAEAQAISRAHRIGQDKQVIAYRFITQNSIEEKILYLQEEKRKLAETFVVDSEALPPLSNEEWANLL